jgi:hypothetical protein
MSFITRKVLYGSCIAVFLLAWLNFTIYWIVGVYLGGFANIGQAEGGRYFLASHGRYTEVSQAVFTYSRIHGYSTLITHALVLVTALLIWVFHKKSESK